MEEHNMYFSPVICLKVNIPREETRAEIKFLKVRSMQNL
jgi:hypothetical protein